MIRYLLLFVLFAAACGGSPTPQPLLPTVVLLPSLTATPTDTPTETVTNTPLPSATPTFSPTPSPSPTSTPSLTPTSTLTPTPVYAHLGALIGTLESNMGSEFVSGFERHVYTVNGRAGEWITLSMDSGNPAVDPVITLYDPQGNPLAMDDESGGDHFALLRGVRLPVDGMYLVQAAGGGFGRYAIHLTRSNEPPVITPIPPSPTFSPPLGSATPAPANGRTLSDHVPITDVLEPSGMARYFIRANVGDFLTIGARSISPSANLRLEVFNPAGEIVISLNANEVAAFGDTLIPALGVIEAGTYTVILRDDSRIGGAYTISYGLGSSHSDTLRGVVAAETTVRGNVERRGLRDVWTTYWMQGDRVAVDVRVDNAQFAASYQLVAPDGTLVAATVTTPDGAPLADIPIPISGMYQIRVEGTFARTYGSYTLTWHTVQNGRLPTPAVGIIPMMSVEDAVLARTNPLYPFQGREGDLVRVHVIGLDSFDPVAVLLAPDRATVAKSDDADGLNSFIEAVLPVDGTYFVQIGGYGGTGGTMRLIVERLE